MYEWSSLTLTTNNYTQYEISNWALELSNNTSLLSESSKNFQCKHNLQYWRNLPYLGYGAGAHGYASGIRTENILSPKGYIHQLNGDLLTLTGTSLPTESVSSKGAKGSLPFPLTPATQNHHLIDLETEMGETMMMGLRLTQEGISANAFYQRFQKEITTVFGSQIERLVRLNLLEWVGEDNNTLRLTQPGRLLGNQVFMEFL